jgi:DNA polymerase-3 subunit beta
MEFTIKRLAFTKALNDVLRAISSKTTIPILTNVKLIADDQTLTLTGSNVDISIETTLSQQTAHADLAIQAPGGITLPAVFFANIVKKLPAEDLHVKLENLRAVITSGSASFTINGQDPANYPQLPELEDASRLTVSASQLADVIDQTIIAASTQESRPVLTGVHLQFNGQQVKAVATDSHRLAQRIVTLTGANGEVDADVVIPAKSFAEVGRMLEGQDRVDIQISTSQVVFHLAETTFYSRLLEGNYPETDRLIPTETTTTLTVGAQDFLGALERAALLSHESRNNVVQLTLSADEAIISGTSQEIGQVQESLTIQKIDGEALEISFNPDYVRDALRVFNGQDVDLKFTSNLRPFTVTPANSENYERLQLITPVRTY